MKTNTSDIREGFSKSPGEGDRAAEGKGRRSPGQIYRRILLGVDFSPAAECVFEKAAKLARQNGAELLVAHADTVPSTLSFMPSTNYDEWYAESRAESKRRIEEFVEKARKQGICCHALAMTGFADEAVVYAAKKLGVDLIVIGNHGHQWFSRFFGQGVASRVVSHAPCSVLLVPLPH